VKITKRQLKRIIKEEKDKLLKEANADGTVSDREAEDEEELMEHVEITISKLLEYVSGEAFRIGGSFRAPAIKARAADLIDTMLPSTKYRRGR